MIPGFQRNLYRMSLPPPSGCHGSCIVGRCELSCLRRSLFGLWRELQSAHRTAAALLCGGLLVAVCCTVLHAYIDTLREVVIFASLL